VKRIANIGRSFCSNPGKIRDGAAVMLGNLMSRPDVVKSGETDLFLTQMTIEYDTVCNDSKKIFNVTGILQNFVEILKTGHRDDLLPRVTKVYEQVLKRQVTDKLLLKSTNIKKCKVKIAQRLGCIFLKPKVARWRYQRGQRSLAQNLANSGVKIEIITNTSTAVA